MRSIEIPTKQSLLLYEALLQADELCPRNDELFNICHHHQHIRGKNGDQPEQAEALLPEHPAFFLFHPSQKELTERIDRRLARKAIINVLIILVRFEPELIRITKEQQAEEQEDDDKSQGG